jgi:hypothetical protein
MIFGGYEVVDPASLAQSIRFVTIAAGDPAMLTELCDLFDRGDGTLSKIVFGPEE